MSFVRSLALLGLAAALAGAALGLTYGSRDGLLVAALFLLTGLPVLGLSHLLVERRARLGPLSRQSRRRSGWPWGSCCSASVSSPR